MCLQVFAGVCGCLCVLLGVCVCSRRQRQVLCANVCVSGVCFCICLWVRVRNRKPRQLIMVKTATEKKATDHRMKSRFPPPPHRHPPPTSPPNTHIHKRASATNPNPWVSTFPPPRIFTPTPPYTDTTSEAQVQDGRGVVVGHLRSYCNTLTATHCNTVQHTATHCNPPQPHRNAADDSNDTELLFIHVVSLQHTATTQHIVTHQNFLQLTATANNTLLTTRANQT